MSFKHGYRFQDERERDGKIYVRTEEIFLVWLRHTFLPESWDFSLRFHIASHSRIFFSFPLPPPRNGLPISFRLLLLSYGDRLCTMRRILEWRIFHSPFFLLSHTRQLLISSESVKFIGKFNVVSRATDSRILFFSQAVALLVVVINPTKAHIYFF